VLRVSRAVWERKQIFGEEQLDVVTARRDELFNTSPGPGLGENESIAGSIHEESKINLL